jgi:hypothetical protein
MNLTHQLWFRSTVLAAAAVLLIGLIGVTAIRVGDAMGATEPEDVFNFTDLEATDFEKPPIPGDENAAAWLKAGAAAIVWSEEEDDIIGNASNTPLERWSKKLEADTREVVERHRGALETLRRAVGLEQSSYGIRYSQGMNLEMPNLLNLLKADRLLMAEARTAVRDGDESRTLIALATMHRLASSLAEESTLITVLVSIACERMTLTVVSEVLSSQNPWVSDLRFLRKLEGFVWSSDGEEVILRVFDAWTAVMELHVNQEAFGSEEELGNLVETIGDVTHAEIQATRSQLIAMLNTPYGIDPQAWSNIGSTTLFRPERKEVFEDLEGFQKAIGKFQSVEAQRQLVTAAIVLRRAGGDLGSYPAARPKESALSHPDPFTGRLLVYELQPDGSVMLALDGAVELAEEIILPAAAQTLAPITLPAPTQ